MRFKKSFLLGAIALLLPLSAAQSARSEGQNIEDSVRKAIMRLPYYGPFDLISFQVSGGTVTLGGNVYLAFLGTDAEEAVRKVPGVHDVVNRIETLPASIADNRLRRIIFLRIYNDEFLSRYGTPIGLPDHRVWGHGFLGAGRRAGGLFGGLEPVGFYAIHIIVKGGRVTLYGNVDNTADRDKAVMVVRGIPGVLGVDSEIEVREK